LDKATLIGKIALKRGIKIPIAKACKVAPSEGSIRDENPISVVKSVLNK
jgi:hypothetical protein